VTTTIRSFAVRAAAALELLRWWNGLLAAASVPAASFVATGRLSLDVPVLAGGVVTFVILGAGNALNDYCDAGVDRWNRPRRPIPSGRIRPRTAVFLAAALFAVGNALGALALPSRALPYPILNSLLLILYGRCSKRVPLLSNLAVAWLAASVFLFGGAIRGARNGELLVLAAGAFLTTFAREVLKDVEDLPGDIRMDARTLPRLIGPRRAARLARLALLPALALLLVPVVLLSPGPGYVVLGVPAFALLASALFLDPPRAQRRLKAAMPFVLAAFVAGAI
jgi:geranylgeranylglycerol-phosphate geranylgeranyltransferase